jgi:hypothetical protein
MTKSLLCNLGIHRWATREVHITDTPQDAHTVETAILERCACGESRFAPFGGRKTTKFIWPEKFKDIGIVSRE